MGLGTRYSEPPISFIARATVEVLPLSNILLRSSLSSVVGEPDHPFEDLEIRHPTYSEPMGFYVQYPILEQVRKNPHRGNEVVGNQRSLPDYSLSWHCFCQGLWSWGASHP